METFIVTSRLAALLLLLSSTCFSQTAPTKPSSSGNTQAQPAKKDADSDAKKPSLAPPPSAASVSENETVITVAGVCPADTPPDNCSTKITRGDFERLIAAMNPNIPVEARRSIASSYGQLIYMANQ